MADVTLESDFETVAMYAQADAFDAIVKSMLQKRERLRPVFEPDDGIDAAMAVFSQAAGLREGETRESVDARFTKGTNPRFLATAGQFGRGGGVKNQATEQLLLRIASGIAAKQEVIDGFFTKETKPRKPGGLMSPTLMKQSPGFADFIEEEQARLWQLLGLESSIAMREATAALLRIARRIIVAYQSLKRGRGLYDFEDLDHPDAAPACRAVRPPPGFSTSSTRASTISSSTRRKTRQAPSGIS